MIQKSNAIESYRLDDVFLTISVKRLDKIPGFLYNNLADQKWFAVLRQ